MTPPRIRLEARPGKIASHTAQLIGSLDRLCFPKDAPYPHLDDAFWWLAWSPAGMPVAFAGLRPLRGENAGLLYLCRAGVLPAWRGHGLHGALLRVRIRYAARLGATHVVTDCVRTNSVCLANLLRAGLSIYDPIEPWALPQSLYLRRRVTRD